MFLRKSLSHSEAGGGASIPTEMRTRDDIERGFSAVQERFNALEKRYGSVDDFNPDDFANLRKQVGDLIKGQEEFVKQQSERKTMSDLTGGDEQFLARVAGLTMPFDPEREFSGMSREYFNIVAYHPDELTYAATASNTELAGMSTSLQRHLRSGAQSFDSFTRQVRELQGLNDALYLMDAILVGKGDTAYARRGDAASRMKSLKLWNRWEKACNMFQRAIAGGSSVASGSYGGAWLPQMFSSQLHDLMQLETVVWGLFPSLDMPAKVYTSPVLGGDGLAYYIPENPSSGGATNGASGTTITESTPQTTNMTLTAQKLAARMFTSSEAEEDVIVPVLPFLLQQLAKVTARALDDAVINGDTSATHMDAPGTNDPTDAPSAATDRRKIWNGLRATAINNANMPLVDITANTDASFLSLKSAMGIYGVRPNEGAWITSIAGLFKLMQATDGNSNKLFLRNDILGTLNTTLLTGQLGAMFGSPVVVSEFCPDDTVAATGKRLASGSGGTKSCVLYVNRPSFQRGQRRTLTINRSVERHIEYDQTVLVSTWRGDFKPWYSVASGANKIVSLGRNYN